MCIGVLLLYVMPMNTSTKLTGSVIVVGKVQTTGKGKNPF